jgi:hypothetical protein
MIPTAVSVSAPIGSRGRPVRLIRAANRSAATAARTATTIAMTTAHTHPATPCLMPLNRAMRPAT